MGIFDRFNDHMAVASGDFEKLFSSIDIPPLSPGISSILQELNKPDADPVRVVRAVAASPDLSARLLGTVNSSYYGLRNKVTSVRHAVSLVGLDQVRMISYSLVARSALPSPSNPIFDTDAFWKDSLAKAIVARALTKKFFGGDPEEAFTAMLLADLAIPILLEYWGDYYVPIISEWSSSADRLSTIERRKHSWDHAQAGAWILRSWSFPEEIVCYVAAHNLALDEIEERGLGKTFAPILSIAGQVPSRLRPREPDGFFDALQSHLGASREDIDPLITQCVREGLVLMEVFDLAGDEADGLFGVLTADESRPSETSR